MANMFPAHAGMNRRNGCSIRVSSHVPRTRGDEPCPAFTHLSVYLCSPHTRG